MIPVGRSPTALPPSLIKIPLDLVKFPGVERPYEFQFRAIRRFQVIARRQSGNLDSQALRHEELYKLLVKDLGVSAALLGARR